MDLKLIVLFSLLLMAGGPAAQAALVLSNLGLTNTSNSPQGIGNNLDINSENASYVGTSFTVGAVSGGIWTLDSVTLSMADAAPGTTGAFSVGIYSTLTSGVPDARPGSLLGTLSGSISPTTAGEYAYTGSVQLTAGQTYWLVAGAPGVTGDSQGYYWNITDGTSYTQQTTGWGVDESNAITQFSSTHASDTGSWHDFTAGLDNLIWRTSSASGGAVDYGADTLLQFSISATAGVPEPSKAGFVLLGLLCLGLRRKRQD